MNKQAKQYHYCYKILFETGQFYIGVRTSKGCTPLEDSYTGSPKDKSLWTELTFEKHILADFATRHEAHSFEISLLKRYIGDPLCLNKKASLPDGSLGGNIGGPRAGLVHSEKAKQGLHPAQLLAKEGKLNFQQPEFIEQVKLRAKEKLALGQHNFQSYSAEQRSARAIKINKSAATNGRHAFQQPAIRDAMELSKRIKARKYAHEDDYNRLRLLFASNGCANIFDWAWPMFNWHMENKLEARPMLRAIKAGLSYADYIKGDKCYKT